MATLGARAPSNLDLCPSNHSSTYVCALLATSELRKRPCKSEVDNASWDCFRGRKQKARPQKQSRDALSTTLLPGLLRNSEVANMETLSWIRSRSSEAKISPKI